MSQKKRKQFSIFQNGLVLMGIMLGAAFWLIESIMHVYVFHRLDFLHSILTPGSHEAWMRMIIVAMFVLFGVYSQWLINARKRAQIALTLANTELEQIFDTSADGMRIVDRNFNMLRANQTFCDLVGLKMDDIIGKKCYEVFKGPLCHGWGCPLILIINGEQRVECDTKKFQQSGAEIPCIVTATPFKGPNGELIGIVEDIKDISELKKNEKELNQSRLRLRELASYLESAREKERTRIAREIHDELGQALTALKMELHWCIQRFPQNDHLLIEKSKAIQNLVDTNVHLVQRISSELRPGLLDNLGLSAAIEWQVGQFQDRTGIKCDIICEPHDIVLDSIRSTAIFRIFQETLTNVARHAQATKVEVMLKKKPGETRLTVSDNGKGITENEIYDPKSFGLMGIWERLNALGGDAHISGIKNKGTTVAIRIPLDKGNRPKHV